MKYIIYKIQINDYIYIGSTKRFAVRKTQHKQRCNNGTDFLVYRTIRENGGWQNCTMVPVREVEVETILQARIIEEEERVKYNAQMNMVRAYRTEEEDKKSRQQREQTDAYKETRCQYAQSDAGKEAQRRREQTEVRKKWREANKERRAETNKLWSEANREHRNEYNRKRRAAKKAEQTSPSIV